MKRNWIRISPTFFIKEEIIKNVTISEKIIRKTSIRYSANINLLDGTSYKIYFTNIDLCDEKDDMHYWINRYISKEDLEKDYPKVFNKLQVEEWED